MRAIARARGRSGRRDPWSRARVVRGRLRPRVAQRLLGGPAELAAPRPLTPAEHAIWALRRRRRARGSRRRRREVWAAGAARSAVAAPRRDRASSCAVELGRRARRDDRGVSRAARRCRARAAAARAAGRGRASSCRSSVGALRADPRRDRRARAARRRDRSPAPRRLELVIGDGGVGPHAPRRRRWSPRVATDYGPRDMALPDDAHLELTVHARHHAAVGAPARRARDRPDRAARSSARRARSSCAPAGRVVGRGELVDVDGELGVRIVVVGESSSE